MNSPPPRISVYLLKFRFVFRYQITFQLTQLRVFGRRGNVIFVFVGMMFRSTFVTLEQIKWTHYFPICVST